MIRRIHILLLLLLSVNACIDPYVADIEEEHELMVIEGSLIRGERIQYIKVSTSSPLLDPRPRPLGGCDVRVLDDSDNDYQFYENETTGTYSRLFTDGMLAYGRQFMLRVITPEGEVYESEFELLNVAAEVDSVYFMIEDKFDAAEGEELAGAQYYIDIEAPDDVPRYFRWSMDETYEYTTTGPITHYLMTNGDLIPLRPEKMWELYRCWITQPVKGLYLSNTINLLTNEKKRIPLHYVSTSNDRMKIKYSLLVKQYTLNEGAYDYWQQNKTATQETGGLYTGQPEQPLTNICNVNDSTERVLGYFWVSSKTEKRIMVPRPPELSIPDEKCALHEFDALADFHPPFPIYVRILEPDFTWMVGDRYCFDCRERGGSLTPPNYWDEK